MTLDRKRRWYATVFYNFVRINWAVLGALHMGCWRPERVGNDQFFKMTDAWEQRRI